MGKSLVEVLEEYGLTLRKSGVRFIAKCPFHGGGDRTPPFTIYPNETYFCFTCNVWGDAVKFLVEKQGMAPDEAMDYVGLDYRQTKRKTTIKITDTTKTWPFLHSVAESYHQNLLQTKGALLYVQSRGLSLETIKKYKIGYSDGGVLNIKWSDEVKMAEKYGILNEKGYELLSHRVVIPNIPEPGLCDAMIGRTVINDKIKYLNIRTPKVFYGLADAWASSVIFVTEGHFDWLILREWGYPAIVVGGTHVKDIDIDILRQRNIVIVPDNDAEGIKAGLRLKAKIGNSAIILDYADMGIKDIGEAATKVGAREEFERIVREQVNWELASMNQKIINQFSILRLKPILPDSSMVRGMFPFPSDPAEAISGEGHDTKQL